MNKLSLIQASRRLEAIRKISDQLKVKPAWIQYMRKVLGLKIKDLAQLTNHAQNTISELEKREIEGKITLNSLTKIAKAMDCEFVYGFIPKKELNTLIQEKAYQKAKSIIHSADTHMSLENQKVSVDIEERIKQLAQKLIDKGDIW